MPYLKKPKIIQQRVFGKLMAGYVWKVMTGTTNGYTGFIA
jgi:hypothetical protein